MIAKQRLYFTAAKTALVAETSDKAAFLYANVGDEIPDSAAEMFGLVDGELKKAGKAAAAAAKEAAEKEAAEAAAKEAAEKETAEMEATAAAEKEAAAAQDKEAKAGANKGAGKAPASKAK